MDQWSGYEACRDRLMRFLAERKPSNPIVITGDIHSNWVSDLKVDWKSEKPQVVGTEFTGTSISSGVMVLTSGPPRRAFAQRIPT